MRDMKTGQMGGNRPALLDMLCNNSPSTATVPVHHASLSNRTANSQTIWFAGLFNVPVGLPRKAASPTEEPQMPECPSSSQPGGQQEQNAVQSAGNGLLRQQGCRADGADACTHARAGQQAGCTADILGCEISATSSRPTTSGPNSGDGAARRASEQACTEDKQRKRPGSKRLTQVHARSIVKQVASRARVRCFAAFCCAAMLQFQVS